MRADSYLSPHAAPRKTPDGSTSRDPPRPSRSDKSALARHPRWGPPNIHQRLYRAFARPNTKTKEPRSTKVQPTRYWFRWESQSSSLAPSRA